MYAPLILPFLLIGIYGWLSAIGFGLSILRLLPRATLVKQALRLLTPVWGLSNVFLVCALLTTAMFFNRNANAIFQLVLPALSVSLGLLLLQSLLVIFLFYSNAKTGFKLFNLLYVACSFLLPLTLSLAGIRLLSGRQFWQSSLGWVLLAALALGLFALAASFAFYVVGHTPHDRLSQLSHWLNIGLSIFAAVGLALTLSTKAKHLHSSAIPLFVSAAASVGVVEILLGFVKRERYSWWYLSLFAIMTPLLLAFTDHVNLLGLRQ